MRLGSVCLVLGVLLTACSPGVKIPSPDVKLTDELPSEVLGDLDTPDPNRGAGGAAVEDNPGPNQLTGLPGIDNGDNLEVRILDARGTGRMAGVPIAAGKPTPVDLGAWLLTDADSEYEITLRSSLLPDGIVRLVGQSAFLIEAPSVGPVPLFRVFGGQAAFYLPHLPAPAVVLTPAGPLTTRGAVFSVTVTPDSQVLVSCREGAVYLAGTQNAQAYPGQVLVADRLGRGRVYAMTPNEAQTFVDRWLKIMTEEAAPVLAANLPRRVAAWNAVNPRRDPEQARFLALWFRQARTVLGTQVPAPEEWLGVLGAPVSGSVWKPLPAGPGLMGETP